MRGRPRGLELKGTTQFLEVAQQLAVTRPVPPLGEVPHEVREAVVRLGDEHGHAREPGVSQPARQQVIPAQPKEPIRKEIVVQVDLEPFGGHVQPGHVPRRVDLQAVAEPVEGGARGVTAAAAAELARRYRPTLVLVGRSPLPSAPEAAETASLHSARELKAALMAQLRNPVGHPDPCGGDARYGRIMPERAWRQLTALEATVKDAEEDDGEEAQPPR